MSLRPEKSASSMQPALTSSFDDVVIEPRGIAAPPIGAVKLESELMTTSQAGMLARVRPVIDEIRNALQLVLSDVAGAAPRASTLARELNIDKTLSARILRALRPPDIASVIYEVPSPEGLRIFLTAASRCGLAEANRDRASRAVRDFERLIGEFPGGRSGLNAAFAGLSPATRDHTERSAKQAIYKSMATLLGFCCDVSLCTFVIRRSPSDPNYIDTAYVLGKFDVRRLRPSRAITMFGRTNLPAKPGDPDPAAGLTLTGSRSDDVRDYLLLDHCSKPLPPLDVVQTKNAALNVLPEGVPMVNESVTMVSGQLAHRTAYIAGGERYPCYEGFTARMPSKVLVMDALVEDGLFDGPPILGTTLQSISGVPVAPGNSSFNLDEVSLQAPVEPLARGIASMSHEYVPDYPKLMEQVFAALNWNPSHFSGYRTTVMYPVPVVNLSYWFPKAPTHA